MVKKLNYKRDGFVHLRDILSESVLNKFRKIIGDYDFSGKEFPLHPGFCLQDEEIMKIVFCPKLVSALKEKFHPEYIMFPDLEVQYNLIGGVSERNKLFDGWHIDSGSEGQKSYLTKNNYGFAKVGIYFQDNTEDYAGGIDLVPFSHRFISHGPLRFRFFVKKVINKLRIIISQKKINTQAGDVLVFDSRLQHRSSRAKKATIKDNKQLHQSGDFISLPKGHEKIVVYFDIAFPNSCKEFWENANKRAESHDPTERRHFSSYTGPDSNYRLFRDYAKVSNVRTILGVYEK